MSIVASITTAEQLLNAGNVGRCELVRGELIMMSPAGNNHGFVAHAISETMGPFVRSRGLGRLAAAETGFLIHRDPDTVRAPDVAFVRKDRMKLRSSQGFFPGPPDLAVEVLSPDDTASAVLDKVEDWLTAGTLSVWIVDPARQTVSIHRSSAAVQIFHAADVVTDESVLPGFRLKVAEVFE